MSDSWYYRVLNEVFGPVSFEELTSLVEGGLIGTQDCVRGESDEEWCAAGAVPELREAVRRAVNAADGSNEDSGGWCALGGSAGAAPFRNVAEQNAASHVAPPGGTARAETHGTSETARDILRRLGVTRDQERSVGVETNAGLGDALRLPESDGRAPPEISRDASDRGLPGSCLRGNDEDRFRLRAIAGAAVRMGVTPGRTAAVAILAAVLAGFAAWWQHVPFDEAAYAQLAEMGRRIESRRTADTHVDDWRAFAEGTTRDTQALIAMLEETAGPESPERLQLLWAARDDVPAMLNAAADDAADAGYAEARLRFDERLRHARTLLDGGHTTPVRNDGRGRSAADSADSGDWLMTAVLVLDAVLVVVGAAFVIRWWSDRRRLRTTR